MFAAVLQREAIDESVVDDDILEAMESGDAERQREGWRAAAISGRSRTLTNLLKAIDKTPVAAEEVAPHLDAAALDRIVLLSNAQDVPARVRSRLLRALSASDLPEVSDIAARGLLSDDEELRELAAHSLLRRARDQGADVPQRTVEEALSRQLDRFDAFVNARTGFATSGRESSIEVNFRPGSMANITAEALFIDELERASERALSDLCGLLALLGKPNTVFAAQRALRAHSFKRRRQGLDILQEVAKGTQRNRLLALLELYLLPPKNPTEEARQKACDIDPWLARCRSGGDGQLTRRLRALRSTALFDVIDGGSLVALAKHCTEVEFSEDDLIVKEGEPGNALYVVIDGAVTVTRDGERVAQLGAGEAFGELALLDGQRRSATATAAVDSKLLRLERETFDSALAEHPEMGLGLLTGLARLLRRATDTPRARRASLSMHTSSSAK
jgi:hypothetical protein